MSRRYLFDPVVNERAQISLPTQLPDATTLAALAWKDKVVPLKYDDTRGPRSQLVRIDDVERCSAPLGGEQLLFWGRYA